MRRRRLVRLCEVLLLHFPLGPIREFHDVAAGRLIEAEHLDALAVEARVLSHPDEHGHLSVGLSVGLATLEQSRRRGRRRGSVHAGCVCGPTCALRSIPKQQVFCRHLPRIAASQEPHNRVSVRCAPDDLHLAAVELSMVSKPNQRGDTPHGRDCRFFRWPEQRRDERGERHRPELH